MLNELSVLSHSLEAHGISVTSWDDRIKAFKKGPAYVARVNQSGRIESVDHIDDQSVAALRRISPQNEKSFPGFNLNHAIYVLPPGDAILEPDHLWELCQSGDLPLGGEAKDRRALGFHLRYATELATDFAHDSSAELGPTLQLLKRISGFTPEDLLRDLARAVVDSVASGRLDRESALVLLLGKLNKKKQTLEPAKPTLILDLADAFQQGGRVASPEAAQAWNRALLATGATTVPASSISCALTGKPGAPIGEKMPQPSLPAVGLTYLMSMNKATPCQTRYGLTSTSVFPITEESGQQLSDAIGFITGPEREGKSFAKVPNASSTNSDLLIAYLEDDPQAAPNLVDLFADDDHSADGAAADYEARTKTLFAALRGQQCKGSDPGIRIFAISKLDLGRAQVLFSGRYTLSQLENGLDAWFLGLRNVPPFSLYLPVGRGQKAERRKSATPSPIDVLLSFKQLWMRGGSANSPVPGVDLARIYQLMLDHEPAAPLLDRYLRLVTPLLIGVGALRADPKAIPEPARRQALTAIPILGLLLFKLGHKKEIYMETPEFLLGQHLQLADLLHKFYCEVVRNENIPPQLAGNAATGAALQNPQRAFQVVCQRIRVYLAWADTCKIAASDSEKVAKSKRLAKWCRRRIGETCAKLADHGLPTSIDDAGRARFFLGYLADLNDKDEKETPQS